MSDPRREIKAVANLVASEAGRLVPRLVRDDAFPEIMTDGAARDAIEAVVTQAPNWKSWRVWASILGAVSFSLAGVSAVLAAPDAGVMFGPKAPVIAAILAAVASGMGSVAAFLSKQFDPRVTRP